MVTDTSVYTFMQVLPAACSRVKRLHGQHLMPKAVAPLSSFHRITGL
jgi:hypothetical protein